MSASLSVDTNAVMARARTAQAAWARLPLRARLARLGVLQQLLIDREASLVTELSRVTGKPTTESLINELLAVVDLIAYVRSHGGRILSDEVMPPGVLVHRKSVVRKAPWGVVLVISPWNFPFMLPMTEIVQALAAGNSVVLKPSEFSTEIGRLIAQLFVDAGFTPGLVSLVEGEGAVGAALIDARPGKVVFIGSAATGKKVAAQCGAHLIPVHLELGGKDAALVLADADLELTASAIVWGGFCNSGQCCAGFERVIAHQSIATPLLQLLKQKLSALEPDRDLGRVIVPRQLEVYAAHLQDARRLGCRFELGGTIDESSGRLAPTIVTGPAIESTQLYRDETFGPTLALTTFESNDEGVRKVNDSRYGLTASIFSRDVGLASRLARELEVGGVAINDAALVFPGVSRAPWGGFKESGLGRSRSHFGLLEFVQLQHIQSPRLRSLQFKAFWWFPHSPHQAETFRWLLRAYSPSWWRRIQALPWLLWHFAKMLKTEPRL